MSKWLSRQLGEIRSAEPARFAAEVDQELSAALAFRPITDEQHGAWRSIAEALCGWAGALPPGCDQWLILMEYAPPLITTRSDLIVVTPDHVVVCEAKVGRQKPGAAARKQALGYATDLYWFHPGARGRSLLPIVHTASGDGNWSRELSSPDTAPTPADVALLSNAGVLDVLKTIAEAATPALRWSDRDQWERAAYSPRPSIVDAAVALFASTEDQGVTAALSQDAELDRLTAFLVQQVHEAQRRHDHRVLLVSGVPGAGKTLVGLRLAHDPQIVAKLRDVDSQPLYLTGNGPLVKVLTEALARDMSRRNGVSLADARRQAGVLVKLVHSFTREGLSGREGLDVPHVAVFDEGQRVWDVDQMSKKHDIGDGTPVSEPDVILARLEEKDWTVVVVLIGDGQEINTGETGAGLWVEAVSSRSEQGPRQWRGFAPDSYDDRGSIRIEQRPELFLATTRRSVGAAWLSDWVAAVLSGRPSEAADLMGGARLDRNTYPILLTRSLDSARRWLRQQARQQHARCGIVASSRAKRLRPYGLEVDPDFQASIDWAKWFLDRPPSLESSGALEVAATEFKCQGLELDFIGLAWSWDLVRRKGSWSTRRLNGGKLQWAETRGEKSRFGINAYRVLLTRGRAGLVIWIPEGSTDDPTRPPSEMDDVADYLRACGVADLP